MSKIEILPKNMLYPCPVVLVSTRSAEGKDNIFTVAWAGTTNSVPPMLSISVSPSRYSHDLISENGVFVVNLPNEALVEAVDYCGLHSGREYDKFEACKLHKTEANHVNCPVIEEAPISLECRVTESIELKSHTLFNAEIVGIHVDEELLNEKKKVDLKKMNPLVYISHDYYSVGELIARGGFSKKK